jgi:cyclohexadieny/prephenate dehydrogenase
VLEMLGRFNEDLAALARAIRWGIVAMGQETAEADFGRARPSEPKPDIA